MIQQSVYDALKTLVPAQCVYPVYIPQDIDLKTAKCIRFAVIDSAPQLQTICDASAGAETAFTVDVFAKLYLDAWTLVGQAVTAINAIPGVQWDSLGKDLPWEADPKVFRINLEFRVQPVAA